MTTGPLMDHQRHNPYGITGTKLADVTSAEEALRLGGLDWTVTKEALMSVVLGNGVTNLPFTDKFATVRHNRDGSVANLGIVGSQYQVIQNEWTTDLLQKVADTSDATFGAAGATHNGNRTFVQMQLPDGVLIGGRDRVNMSIVVFNSHDGSSMLTGIPTAVRLACTNQFAALKRTETKFAIRHTARGMDVGIEQIRKSIDLTFAYAKEIENIGGVLVQAPMSNAEFGAFVDKYSPPVIGKKTKLELVTSILRRDTLKDIFASAPNLDNIRGTQWAALQTVIEYEDWVRPVKKGSTMESRMVAHTADNRKLRAQTLLLAR